MYGWIVALFILFLIIVWIRTDIVYGRKKLYHRIGNQEQKRRLSDVELLPLGDVFFHRLLHDLRQAEHHIHILFYIFRDDYIGKKVIDILEDKAKQGIKVRLLVDRIGADVSRKSRKRLKNAGVLFAYSHIPSFPFFFTTLNRRNHRKIVVIDGKVGYVGGYNIGDEYLGRKVKFGLWRDFHLRIEKDGVQDLQAQFLNDWSRAKQTVNPDSSYFPPLLKGNTPIIIRPTDGFLLEETFQQLIQKAKKEILLGTPYYVPSKGIQKELIEAAKRGVDVKVVVPKTYDHPLVKYAAFPYFHALLEAGIEIYQYYRGFYHTKALIIDNECCDIGTANFDKRSLYFNSEINCLIFDPSFTSIVKKELTHDIAISERLTLESMEKRSPFHKGKEKIATLVSDLL